MNPQLKKGLVEMCILSLISAAGEMYGYEIIEQIREDMGETPEATIYLALKRLNERGYISFTAKPSEAGPPRKYYRLSEKGTEYLTELRAEWGRLEKILQKYIQGAIL